MIQDNRVALVTGANKGIGLEIARQLAEAGLTVLLGARDPEKDQAVADDLAASNLRTHFVQLDVTDEASIAAAADHIATAHGRLDILVNNAGIGDGADASPSGATPAVVRKIMDTNFIGVLAVTQALLPLLRKSTAGRIVNLSSPLGSLAIARDPSSPFYAYRLIGYNASKAALNMLTLQLAAELEGSSIKVNAVVPGFVQTDLTNGEGTMTAEEGARLPVRYALSEDGASGRFVAPDGAGSEIELPW